ncbi:MAG: MarR family winged helix-turn-helix transcriptional regulator [Gemmatimonadaceae bacterium]
MAKRRLSAKMRNPSTPPSSAGIASSSASLTVSSGRPARGTAAHRQEVTSVVDALRRIVRALHQSHRRAEQRWQLSAAQLLVLERLAEAPSLSVNELADRTYTHQSTVSVVVTRLVARGLVRRSRAGDDARRAELALTTSGRALLQRAMSSALTQLFDALDAMPTARLRIIGGCLDGLVEALGVSDEPPGMFFEDSRSDAPSRASKRHSR